MNTEIKMEEKHSEKIQEVIAWVMSQKAENNYMSNLQSAFKSGFVTEKTIGLVVSAVSAFNRAMGEKITKAVSEFVGVVGEKISKKVTLKFSTSWETQFGITFLYSMVDDSGNVMTWKASRQQYLDNDPVMTSDVFEIAGTVKDHMVYKDVKQTILTRCKIK